MNRRGFSCCVMMASFALAGTLRAESAHDIVEASGVKGGIILHVGCGDGALTAALRRDDSYLVQGLDTDEGNVAAARAKLGDAGLNGPVSISQFDGEHLPYIDSLVNLVVVSGADCRVSLDEIERVLVPRGVALVKGSLPGPEPRNLKPESAPGLQGWKKYTKPVPPEIDEWPLYLHHADNNAVSEDQTIHPPKYLQWVGSPRYSRHHDHMSVMGACVSAGGRIYHVMDEATRLSIFLKPIWKVVARDAFNGTILWKRDIVEWYNHLHKLKSGPAFLPRKLAAHGDTLYASLGLHEPLSVIDGATGKTLRTFVPDMECDEIVYADGVLYLVGSARGAEDETIDERAIKGNEKRRVVAVNAESGAVAWEVETPVLPLTLTVSGNGVFLHDGTAIVALDRMSGKKLWTSAPMEYWKNMHPLFAPTLVAYKDVLFFTGGKGYIMHRSARDTMYALSAKNGKTLWSGEHPPSGYQSPEDILVVDGLVWCEETTSGSQSGELIGRDPWTGEEKRRFGPDVKTYWFHHRCYKARATVNYFLTSRTGIEFVDYRKEKWTINHWVRGACLYGIMPANGFVYAPQHPCACYPEVKLSGFNALSSHRVLPADEPTARLVKGPAYGTSPSDVRAGPADWPTFRSDTERSGSSKTQIADTLQQAWKVDVGGRVSQPVVADGRLFVAQVDAHTVHAFDEKDGHKLWSFTAGARVDSAPTIYKGLALFGSCDGWVYCLRAADGVLAWKYLAASRDAKHMAFEQVESVWPVPGNILVRNDVAYFACGRNIFLDGGLQIYRMNPLTGEVLSKTPMTNVDPDGKPIQDYIKVLDMPPGQSDIMSSDGKYVYLRSQPFDLNGKRTRIDRVGIADQRGEDAHLFCPSGFLDDSWWHRTYQVYGRSFAGGHSGYFAAGKNTPSGKLMVFDDKNIYAFARDPEYYRWTTVIEHHLYKADRSWTKQAPDPAEAKTSKKARNDVSGSMIQIPVTDSLDPVGKPLAVEAWVKADAPNGVVIARGGPANGYALVLQKGKPRFIVRTDGDVFRAAADVGVMKKWVHLAGVLTSNKKLRIYVDGFAEGEGDVRGPVSAVPIQGTEIGADAAGSVGDYPTPSLFTGTIDEVRIYHGELTPAEIKQHAKDASNVAAGNADLVLRLSFDKGNANDTSGKGNNGTPQSVAVVDGKLGKAMRFAGGPAKPARKRANRQPFEFIWTQDVPLFARGMVKVPGKLIVAGPQDIIDETKLTKLYDSPEMQVQMEKESAMLAGKVGGVLWMVSDEDGSKQAELHLDSPPSFDGMIAANESLYISGMDGSVTCFRAK